MLYRGYTVYKLTACTCFWDKLQSVKMFYDDHNGYLHSPMFLTTEGIICCNLNNSVNLTLLHVCNTVYVSLVKCDVFLCYIILANYPVSVTWTISKWKFALKELEHRKLGWKVLILKYDSGKSKEMWCKMADTKKVWLHILKDEKCM